MIAGGAITKTCKQCGVKFNARVAEDALREKKTLSRLESPRKVYAIQIPGWRKMALEQLRELFVDGWKKRRAEAAGDALHTESGRLKGELDRLEC